MGFGTRWTGTQSHIFNIVKGIFNQKYDLFLTVFVLIKPNQGKAKL